MSVERTSETGRSALKRYSSGAATLGVVGSAVTLLTKLQDIVALEPWAVDAIEIWQFVSNLFWRSIANFFSLSMSPWLASLLTFSAFILVTSIGVRLSSTEPRLGVWGVLGRLILLSIAALALIFIVSVGLVSVFGLAFSGDQRATLLAMGAIYAPCVLLVVYLTRRNFGSSSFFTWTTIALSSGVALLFAISIMRETSIAEDVRLLLFALVFGVMSGFAIGAPLLLAPHRDLLLRYVAIYGVVAVVIGLSETTKALNAP